MRRFMLGLLAAFSIAMIGSAAPPQQAGDISGGRKGGVGSFTGPYEIPDLKWPAWAHPYAKPGYIWGSQGGVFAESPNRIWLTNRGLLKLPDQLPPDFPGNWGFLSTRSGPWPEETNAAAEAIAEMRDVIVVVDGDGKLIEAWNQWDHLFEFGRGPHGIYISPYDPDRHVWVVDDIRHVIWKFSHDGKRLVQTLGVPGEMGNNDDLTRFRRPTAIDWLPDGTFFVSDGYGNTRVVKFDKNGKPLMKWGSRGRAPGQFNTPHGIAVGGLPPRVFVSDRGNRRIQVFDTDGRFVDEWPGIGPHSMMMSADQHIWAADSSTDRIVKFDLNGHEEFSFGQHGTRAGYIWCAHGMSADSDGNLYVAECFNGRTQKFRPRPGADPRQMVWSRPLLPQTGGSTSQ